MIVPNYEKLSLEVSHVSKVPLYFVNDDVVHTINQMYPDVTAVNLARSVTFNSNNYKKGMIVVHGSCGGLSEFLEIIQLCIFKDQLNLIIK